MTNDLPLRWTRFIILSILTIIGIVTSALCVQMFEQHTKANNAANKSVPSGIKTSIDYHDVQTTVILLFLTSNVVTFVASHIVMALIQDMYHIAPESLARRLKLTGKTLSTSTLGYQVIGLAFSTIISVIPLSVLTAFVFTKEAKVMVVENGVAVACPTDGQLKDFCSRVIYDETPYIRINAEFPWTMVLLGSVGTLVTGVAWYRQRWPRAVLGHAETN